MACRLSGFVLRKSCSIYSSTQITRISKTFSASPKINQLSCIVQYQMNKNMCTDKKPQKIGVALEFILPEHVLKAVKIPKGSIEYEKVNEQFLQMSPEDQAKFLAEAQEFEESKFREIEEAQTPDQKKRLMESRKAEWTEEEKQIVDFVLHILNCSDKEFKEEYMKLRMSGNSQTKILRGMDLCQEAGMDIQKPMQEKFERYEQSVNEPNSTFLPKAMMVFFANIVFIFGFWKYAQNVHPEADPKYKDNWSNPFTEFKLKYLQILIWDKEEVVGRYDEYGRLYHENEQAFVDEYRAKGLYLPDRPPNYELQTGESAEQFEAKLEKIQQKMSAADKKQ